MYTFIYLEEDNKRVSSAGIINVSIVVALFDLPQGTSPLACNFLYMWNDSKRDKQCEITPMLIIVISHFLPLYEITLIKLLF